MSKITEVKNRVETRWRRMARWAQWTIISVIVLLIALRLALPYAIEHYLNHQLAKIPEYSGHIGKVQVHLWRGAYEIDDIRITKSSGEVPVPLFSAPVLDLSVQWRELFHGAVVGEILLKKPDVNIVMAKSEEHKETGANKPWGQTLASFFPVRINKFEVRDGQIHFRNFEKEHPVNVYVTNLHAIATNLSNTRDLSQKLPAGLKARGGTLGGGLMNVDLKMNPLENAPTFELNASLTNVDMVELNDFLRSYGKLDVARGNFSVYTSVASKQGAYEGYVKVLFQDLDVFQWEKERKKNILDIFWEGIVGVLSEGFRNHPHDQLAAQIPISGSFGGPHFDLWSAAGSLLKNAFIRALIPKIEPAVKVDDVKKPSPDSAQPASDPKAHSPASQESARKP